jgi:hypothetical protein
MRFRTGLIVGGAVGYYLGAKAGRQRYEQLNHLLHKVTDSPPVQSAATRMKTTIGRNVEPDHPTVDDTIDLIQPEWSA